MELSDKQLIEAFLAGDDAAFEELVKRYLKTVYNFLYRLTGGDIAVVDDGPADVGEQGLLVARRRYAGAARFRRGEDEGNQRRL